MYKSMKQLQHYKVVTNDGEKSGLDDFFFHQDSWKIHYLIVDVGAWLSKQQVLVHPDIVKTCSDEEKALQLSASGKEIDESPSVATDLPVSYEAETLLAKYWGWLPKHAEGPLPYEAKDTIQAETTPDAKDIGERAAESKLRSFEEVRNYTIYSGDDKFGHLEDLLFDADWRICYAIIDPRNWVPGKHVLLPVQQIKKIQWSEHALHVGVSHEMVKTAPKYDPTTGITTEDEKAAKEHFKGV
jgi:hypothetical protein